MLDPGLDPGPDPGLDPIQFGQIQFDAENEARSDWDPSGLETIETTYFAR